VHIHHFGRLDVTINSFFLRNVPFTAENLQKKGKKCAEKLFLCRLVFLSQKGFPHSIYHFMPDFDFAFVGFGGAAHLLADALLKRQPHLRFLLLDPQEKQQNDRTWCFWAKPEDMPYPELHFRQWDKLYFSDTRGTLQLSMQPYGYGMLRSKDVYAALGERILPQSKRVFEEVESVTGQAGNKQITTKSGQTFSAKWVFDSRYAAPEPREGYHYLLQHFLGYVVQIPTPQFTPDTFTMFDLNFNQKGEVRFMYVLPFSETEALVEFTVFGPPPIRENKFYEEKIKKYLAEKGIRKYTISETEKGAIPMTNLPFSREARAGHYRIGLGGGLAKPSTGYAFLHMYRDAQYLADYFAQHQTFPQKLRRTPWRYRFFDTLLLDIMAREGNDIRRIFGHLFRNNPTARVFDFLSERSTLWQDFQVMASVPPWPFLRAIPRVFWAGWRG